MAAATLDRRPNPGVVAGVLLLHLVLMAGLLRLGAWSDRGAPVREQPPLVVRLLWPQPAAAQAPIPPTRPTPPRATATPVRAPTAMPPRTGPATEPQAITLPASPPSAPPTPGPATPDAAPPPAPLNLSLPRGASAPWRQRNAALDDPRANTPRPTLESRLAELLGGSDQVTEERLDDGRMRFRRGNTCVVVHPNRAERLDPWNASVLPKMRGAEKC